MGYVLLAMMIVAGTCSYAQKDKLKAEIETAIKGADGEVGIGIMDLSTKETLLFGRDHKFPMQSIFKFPLAMAVLDQVDKGKLQLDQKIRITKQDLLPNTWSPLRVKYPEGNADVTIAELLGYTVSQSDNNGCDILFRLVGGTRVVDSYIKKLGVKGIAIVATEEEMARHWDVQYTNYCYPAAMLRLLEIFHEAKKLSRTSTEFLWKRMVETSTGPGRIKGLLPKDAIVGHKTGTSGTNEGLLAATNDVGIMQLPNGKNIAVVIYISDTRMDEKNRDLVTAKVSRLVWDHYSK
ncbi:Extended-spectrum beta-lactamase PER-1 [Dyadobacter sp. CECT 9275]|uniref:beta-lactamase n=2 Tax=Dyadobacter helix TaxID=2822344 RepID=A0A916JDX7_9BACT|nr:Extended-spectrum beta-lactamase PER-1 [Dyadobacter sp. CECT 9275]